jgi:hypothetical protein
MQIICNHHQKKMIMMKRANTSLRILFKTRATMRFHKNHYQGKSFNHEPFIVLHISNPVEEGG